MNRNKTLHNIKRLDIDHFVPTVEFLCLPPRKILNMVRKIHQADYGKPRKVTPHKKKCKS